jgi:hypothetical protein
MAKGAIRPEALAAGAVTFLAMAFLYNKESNRCVEFAGLWKDHGPIYLKQEVQDEAFGQAAMHLRSNDAAGHQLTVFQLRDWLLERFEPKCSWASIESDRGKKIFQSFTDIARYSIDRFYAEKENGGS